MLLLPLVSIWIMPFAVIALLAMPFGLETYPLLALDKGIGLMLAGSHYIAALPYAAISLPSPSFAGIMAAVFGGLWFCVWLGKKRLIGLPFVIVGIATIALHQPHDLLISADASKVALRGEDGNFVFLRGKPDSFDGEVWLRANGFEKAAKLEEGVCDKYKCTVEVHGKKIVVMKGKKEIEASCEGNPDIVISQNVLDKKSACANVPMVIDGEYLEYFGATALRFVGGEVRIESSRDYRGERIWVR
jgi:competence protein ComEC